MKPDKRSIRTDAVGNLYRASFYLASGSRELGLDFFEKAKTVLGEALPYKLNPEKDEKILAEEILDQYVRLRDLYLIL